MSEEQFNQNQTQFSAQEPLMEKPEPVVAPAAAEAMTPAKPARPKWLWWVIGLVALLVILVVALAIFNRPQAPEEVTEEPTPVVEEELSPLEQRLKDAQTLLKNGDPTVQTLPFPPLNMELKIDG